MFQLRMLKYSDVILWISVVILLVISFFLIYAATFSMQLKSGLDAFYYVKKHFVSLVVALAGLAVFSYVDYKHLKSIAYPFFGFMLLVLVGVIFIGYESQGAQRWLSIGSISFQPSEIAKFSLIIVLAKYFYDCKNALQSFKDFVAPAIIAGIPFILIFKQPDLGTSLVSLAIFFGELYWAHANQILLVFMFSPVLSMAFSVSHIWWIIYMIILFSVLYFMRIKAADFSVIYLTNIILGIGMPILWSTLKDYQKSRFLSFLNPGVDPLGAGYHALQSQIAIGSGRLFGRGFLHGTQTQLQFIPKQWMDFIFSGVGEEFGFVGSFIVLGLLIIIIWRGTVIAMGSEDFFGTLLAGGITSMYTFHLLVNVGMTLGIMPVVGIPLPFLSFGGSALLINLICIGILQSIAMRRHKILF